MDDAILAILTGEKALINERTVYATFWILIGLSILVYIFKRLNHSYGTEIKHFYTSINKKKALPVLWSVFCIPVLITLLIRIGYTPGQDNVLAIITVPIICLHGVYLMNRLQINNRILKAFILIIYICLILFILLVATVTIGCNNGGGCFVH